MEKQNLEVTREYSFYPVPSSGLEWLRPDLPLPSTEFPFLYFEGVREEDSCDFTIRWPSSRRLRHWSSVYTSRDTNPFTFLLFDTWRTPSRLLAGPLSVLWQDPGLVISKRLRHLFSCPSDSSGKGLGCFIVLVFWMDPNSD